MVSRHLTRGLGNKISGRIKLSPAAMEATHDIDFLLWLMEPARPVRVYSQSAYGAMQRCHGFRGRPVDHDQHGQRRRPHHWRRLDHAAGLSQLLRTWIEITGTEGMLVIDDTHRDVIVNTMQKGIQLPMSSMPGERVDHVFAGPMHNETVHWIEAVAFDRPEMCSAETRAA